MRVKVCGFTLLEMVMVLTIVGIAGSIAVPEYTKLIERARATEAIVNLGYIRTAEEIHRQETGEYTKKLSKLGIDEPNDHPRRLFEYKVTKATAKKLVVQAKRNKKQGGNGKSTYTINELGETKGP